MTDAELAPLPAALFDALRATDFDESRRLSVVADRALGFRVEEVEDALRREARGNPRATAEQTWLDLPIASLQTPYAELNEAIDLAGIGPEARWCDLGAAYGRLGALLSLRSPGADFLGFEIAEARVREGNRVFAAHGWSPRARLECQDLAAPGFVLPDYDVFFIYDFGHRPSIEQTLRKIQEQARSRVISVIGRGFLTRTLIEREHPWLSQVAAPIHRKNFSIYRTRSTAL